MHIYLLILLDFDLGEFARLYDQMFIYKFFKCLKYEIQQE